MPHHRIRSGGPLEARVGYCRAVATSDGWVHVSGTVGQDHETGEIPASVLAQCQLALGHIENALETAGASWADVVRVTYVVPDRAEFEACWPLLADCFGDNPPAAMMIEAGLIDPAMKIEIEVTAKVDRSA